MKGGGVINHMGVISGRPPKSVQNVKILHDKVVGSILVRFVREFAPKRKPEALHMDSEEAPPRLRDPKSRVVWPPSSHLDD